MGPHATLGARIGEAAAAAQALQGPLDGGWIVRDCGGRPLFALELSDPVGGLPLSGAWRDLTTGRSAPILAARRDGRELSLILSDGPRDPRSVHLRRRRDGGWTGEMTAAGVRRRITLARD